MTNWKNIFEQSEATQPRRDAVGRGGVSSKATKKKQGRQLDHLPTQTRVFTRTRQGEQLG
jgi:hypothetical protein